MARILIVDDWPDARYLLRTILEHAGHEVLEAANGAEALERARSGGCDVVISDGLMPVMDGFRLCLELKRDPATAALPFIFHTASFTEPADARLAEQMGARAYLLKPASARDILSAIGAALAETSPAPAVAIGDEQLTDVLDRYGERIERKLDQKVADLEQTRSVRDSYHALLDHLPLLIITLDLEGRPDFSNRTVAAFTGASAPSALIEAMHPDDAVRAHEMMAAMLAEPQPLSTTLRIRSRDGSYRLFTLSAHPYAGPEGEPLGFVLAAEDITAREQQRETLLHIAEHDPLTDLPSRHVFDRRFDEVLRSVGTGARCALLFIGTDSVGSINDRYGFDIGDATVANLAHAIADTVRPGDLVARLCGTEFVVLAEGIGRAEAEALAESLAERISASSLVPSAPEARLEVTIGINLVPEDAGSRGPTRRPGGHTPAEEPSESALRQALEGAPALLFVPVYSLEDGSLVRCSVRYGFEVERRIVAGDELELGMAKHGVARRINARVIETVLETARDHSGTYSVPLSLASMLDLTIFERTELAAERAGVDPARLLFEVSLAETGGIRPPAGWVQAADRSPVRLVHGCAELPAVERAHESFGHPNELQVPVSSVLDPDGQPRSHAAERMAEWVDAGIVLTVRDVDDPKVLSTLASLGVQHVCGEALARPSASPDSFPTAIDLKG